MLKLYVKLFVKIDPKLYKIPKWKKDKDNISSTSSHTPIVSENAIKPKSITDKNDQLLLLLRKKKENDMNIKKLLGELYEDKKYFELLKNDKGNS